MKVVQINSVCGTGSTGRIVVDISEKMNKHNIENYIFYGIGNSDYTNSINFGNKFNTMEHQLKTRLLGKHGFYSRSSTLKLVQQLKLLNPDIVHLHNIHGHYLNIELLFDYLRDFRKKTIWTLHDCWSYTGHCAYYDYSKCDRWKSGCFECPSLRDYPKSLIFDRSCESYKDKRDIFNSVEKVILVTPSHWLEKEVKQSFLNKYPIRVINNGIDLNVFRPINNSTFRITNNILDKFIILGVANVWEQRKGLNYFIDLSYKLNSDEIIILVGLSQSQIDNLPANIIGIQRTDSVNELAEIYSTADVFVNSTLEDNFPTTNLEALACGLPVITFNTGGSPEAINDETGIVVEKGNLNQLFEAINIVKKNGKNKYSNYCVKRAKKYFQKEVLFEKYIELYQEVFTLNNIDTIQENVFELD